MKNLFALTCLFLFSIACTDSNTNQKSLDEENNSKTEENIIDKTVKTMQVNKMPAAEATKKFGIDFEPNLLYSGSYEYYEADGKEVLHGKMKLESKERIEEYVARMTKSKANPDEEDFSVMHSYAAGSIDGQYVDGVKDGVFTQDASYYEGEGLSTITFDAKTQGCTMATYDGVGEGFCFKYEGKLENCTFAEITTRTEEVECE